MTTRSDQEQPEPFEVRMAQLDRLVRRQQDVIAQSSSVKTRLVGGSIYTSQVTGTSVNIDIAG